MFVSVSHLLCADALEGLTRHNNLGLEETEADVLKGVTKGPEFKAINPLGQVPVYKVRAKAPGQSTATGS